MESGRIAIVGIGCRLPGGANSPAEFWRLLIDGIDAITDVPPDRWDMRRFFDSDRSAPGRIYARQGGFLPTPVDRFDAAFFGMAPREAAVLDPQQKLLLEVAWECMEDAGIAPSSLQRSRSGVFIGGFTLDSQITLMGVHSRDGIMPNTATGTSMTMLSNRLSYAYDLRGPSVSIDTACSSSLVATHLACRSLVAHECDAALAGGVNVMTRPEYSITMCQGGFLSPSSRCRAFDHRADGYVRGEGGAIVMLKRLEDAVRDGNRIYAIVRATGTNQDGRTSSITVPSMESQEALIREVCERAGVPPCDVHIAEAHGTGTQAGDPVEAAALGSALGAGRTTPLIAGSVKTNIGHLEAGAGVAGLIKLALSLYHRVAPRSLHFERANPRIDLDSLKLAIATENTPLAPAGDLFGVVNSFGYGGANAHALLSSPPPPKEQAPSKPPSAVGAVSGSQIFPISAADEAALAARAAGLSQLLDADTDLTRWGSTLSHGRSHLPHRAAIIADNAGELRQGLKALADGRVSPAVIGGRARSTRTPVFVYTGMGAQWWGMGDELFRESPVFRESIEACDQIWQSLAGDSLVSWFAGERNRPAKGPGSTGEAMDEPGTAQPANLVLQIALTSVWRALGVRPGAILGHSVGEIAAAYAAGALTLEQTIRVVFHRSRLHQRLVGQGGMLAVALGEREAAGLIERYEPRVVIAAMNSDASTTLSGETLLLDEIEAHCVRRNIFARRLRVAVPAHGPQMDILEGEFRAALRDLTPCTPVLPLYSTVSEKSQRVGSAIHDAAYWWRNAREPVMLRNAVTEMLADGYDTFIEVGPQPVLAGSIEECARRAEVAAVVAYTIKRKSPERNELLIQAARLYTAGVDLDWSAWFEPKTPVPLPLYPWQRTRSWSEGEAGRLDRVGDADAPALLQRRCDGPFPAWESDLNRNFCPWLDDHQVHGLPVLPAAAYVATALEAARLLERALVLRQFRFPLPLLGDRTCTVRVEVDGEDAVRFHSRRPGEGTWALNASGRLVERSTASSVPAPLLPNDSRDLREMAPSALYDGLRIRGLTYGPAFQTVKSFLGNGHEFVTTVALPADYPDAAGWMLHPAVLDGAFQAFLSTLPEDGPQGAMVPVSIDEVRVFGPVPPAAVAVGKLRLLTAESLVGDMEIRDAAGAVIVQVHGLRCQTVRRAEADNLSDWFYEEVWEPADAPAPADGRWIVLHSGDHDLAHGQLVARALRMSGADAPLARFDGRPPEGPFTGVVLSVAAAPDDLAGTEAAPVLASMLQSLIGLPEGTRVVVVTRSAQAPDGCDASPADAALWGLARVAHNEIPSLRLRLVDVNHRPASGPLAGAITGETEETEFSVRGFDTRVCRLARLHQEAAHELRAADVPCELVALRPGSPDSLAWVETERRAPLRGEIEIAVRAVPLNFKDLIKAMGVLPASYMESTYSGNSLGLEAAGVVTRIGEDVTAYRVGDEVVTPSPSGCFRTHVTASTEYVIRKPAHQTFEEAGCYVNFVTAYYGLSSVARLAAGERVLIHSATGGVGLAAIQVARAAGAEVFATAGSEDKRAYLREIGVKFIYDSRTVAFADQLLADTGGQGVDVVLNSQPGEVMRRSIDVLKPYGRFIEIGKRAIHDDAALRLHAFDRNLTFSAIDLDRMMADNPPLFRRLLDEVHQRFEDRTFQALPNTVFAGVDAPDAFRLLGRGHHIGKIAVTIDGSQRPRRAAGAFEQVRRDGTYLITGGFGGFGRILAGWLADQGARAIVLVSRRGATTDDAREFVRSLEQRGAEVWVEALDIGDRDSVNRLVGRIQAAGHSLAGVFHTAMVLDDCALQDLTPERLSAVMKPKALGAIWLDEATKGLGLHAFVLFSSISAITGNPGQSSYVAANAVLDALAHRRRARGEPALSVNWGVLRETGFVARNRHLEAHLDRLGIRGFRALDALECLSRLLSGELAQAGVLDVDWERWAAASPDGRAPRFSNFVDARGRGIHPLAAKLAAMTAEERSRFVEDTVCAQLARVVRSSPEKIDVDLSLENMGVDSLMSVELVTGLREALSIDLPPMLVMQGRSIRMLARQILGTILPNPTRVDDGLDETTEEELDALLAGVGEITEVIERESDEPDAKRNDGIIADARCR